MAKWYDPGADSKFLRAFCWMFGCHYEDEIGGGWCQLCGADNEIYWKPIWKRLKDPERGDQDVQRVGGWKKKKAKDG